ncbi:tetratricopeptide repeat protein [Microbispora sp. KK1-11]|uniref:tetratricopeptide repeat protein n=1 Tax=Microbispora sp. KK1-11 TaxID=2053005 RepID=UPI00115B9609|nr:tetratricopeptide repeat protein [Microbispora sp. KK1-11]TQS30295.1 tetratricopeptide repeat protein [Microbispora sp. KK1-11]
MRDHPSHIWVRGDLSRDRVAALRALALEVPPPVAPVVNGHRRLRGPYTVGGAILRALVPVALERSPDLVAEHDIEIRAAAPSLRSVVPPRRQTIEARLTEDERILVPAPRRTLRIANGIAEFVRDCLEEPRTLLVDNLHEADPADRELLRVLARRVPGLTLALASAEPQWEGTRLVEAPVQGGPPDDYVVSDCTSDDPRAYRAYLSLPSEERARRHDRRVAELRADAAASEHALGAVPYHLEHGGDLAAAARALWAAVDHCVTEGFLHAVVELGSRGLRLVEPGSDLWWRFTHRTATALAGLGRRAHAQELYDQARRVSVDPAVHAAAAYGTAMLDARDRDPARRDLTRARAWINEAIAISMLLPDRRTRAFKLGFDQNGRALIELREGRVDEALGLVRSAIDLADRDLAPDDHPVHRMVLFANRAQLLARLGRREEALADFDRAVAIDPGFPDHYLDRGNLLFEMGRTDEALADYETAMRVSPPLPEAYYNRAEMRLAAGDLDGARADLDHVLDLDPGYLDAYVNRAGVLEMLGEHEAARRDVEAGLALDPGNAHLHGVLGQLETEAGRYAEAALAFDAALAADARLASAWANRATLRFETGDARGAVDDLTRAIELGEDAALYFNRATALDALGRGREALLDLRRALALAPGDPDVRAALERHDKEG